MPITQQASEPSQSTRFPWVKLAMLVSVALLAGGLYARYGDSLSLQSLADRESQLREFQLQNPLLVYGAAFAIYATVTGLSIPGAVALTLMYGWFFGFWRGVILVSFASTTGATVAFLLARFLLQDTVQTRFGDRLKAFNQALEREGAFYLFTLRLIPLFPFFVINLVMGLTPLRTSTYWWVSQLGMLPGTAVYVYAGSSVPDLATLADRGTSGILTPNVLIAFALLGLFPLVIRKIFQWTVKKPALDANSKED